jgi:hypothetical protein
VPHRLGVRNARERRGHRIARHFAYPLHHRFDHFVHAFLLRERHLQVDLREFGLPVGAQIFVPETADNLEILLVPRHHQQLFEDLRRLRQRIEIARLHAARHQVIARALRRRAGHERRFDFEKALAVEKLARGVGNFGAQNDIGLHARAPQIHVAVAQARVLGHLNLLLHREWRGARFVQDPDLGGDHLDLACRHLRIDGRGSPGRHPALHRDHVFRPDFLGPVVHRRVHVFMKDHLGDAVAVAQVHEDHAAVIPAAVHPPHQQNSGAFVGSAQGSAHVSAAQLAQKIESNGGFHIECYQFRLSFNAAAISSGVSLRCSPVDMFLRA